MEDPAHSDEARTFIDDCKDVDEDIAVAVFQYLKEWSPRHAPSVNDDLGWVYGIVDDDLVDAVVELARATKCRLPQRGVLGDKPVRTAQHLADTIQYLRRKS